MTETPLPVEFDPKTLATLGKPEWPDREASGQVTTAHPHYDFERDEMVNYTAHFGPRTTYRLYAAGQLGAKRRLIGSLPVKAPGYMHSRCRCRFRRRRSSTTTSGSPSAAL